MNVLITAASRHGATSGIAGVLAESLRGAGLTVDVVAPEDVTGIERYDAVVLGSAVYAGRWLDTARAFVDRHAEALATVPLWLFSSGPIGDPPKPVEGPPEAEALRQRLGAREHRILSGRLDRDELGFLERTVTRALRAPDGDFRDWDVIRAWAGEIATTLAESRVPAG
jgi:menaquinone-dependent protoporphyrinogen oxidase